MPTTADLDALLATLHAMDEGRVEFWVLPNGSDPKFDYDWDGVYAGNVVYETETGWRIEVFNDCDSFDYVDSAVTPDGTAIEFEDFSMDYDREEPGPKHQVYNFAPNSQRFITAQPKGMLRKPDRPPPENPLVALARLAFEMAKR